MNTRVEQIAAEAMMAGWTAEGFNRIASFKAQVAGGMVLFTILLLVIGYWSHVARYAAILSFIWAIHAYVKASRARNLAKTIVILKGGQPT